MGTKKADADASRGVKSETVSYTTQPQSSRRDGARRGGGVASLALGGTWTVPVLVVLANIHLWYTTTYYCTYCCTFYNSTIGTLSLVSLSLESLKKRNVLVQSRIIIVFSLRLAVHALTLLPVLPVVVHDTRGAHAFNSLMQEVKESKKEDKIMQQSNRSSVASQRHSQNDRVLRELLFGVGVLVVMLVSALYLAISGASFGGGKIELSSLRKLYLHAEGIIGDSATTADAAGGNVNATIKSVAQDNDEEFLVQLVTEKLQKRDLGLKPQEFAHLHHMKTGMSTVGIVRCVM